MRHLLTLDFADMVLSLSCLTAALLRVRETRFCRIDGADDWDLWSGGYSVRSKLGDARPGILELMPMGWS
jgi:hypothetical protein